MSHDSANAVMRQHSIYLALEDAAKKAERVMHEVSPVEANALSLAIASLRAVGRPRKIKLDGDVAL